MKKLTVIVVLLVAACGDLPDPVPNGFTPPQGVDGSEEEEFVPPNENDPPPAAPVIATLPGRYGYESIPLRGTTAPFLSVFVEGGKAPIASDADSDGDFCIDVPLLADATQTLEVFAQDIRGETSQPAVAVVEHDSSLVEATPQEQPLVELAAGLTVYSDQIPKEGQLAYATDGDSTTDILVKKSTLWIDFGAVYEISAIDLVFTDSPGAGEDTFATEYQVMASEAVSPTMTPSASSDDWTVIADVYPGSLSPGGDGGVDSFELETPLMARYIAVYVIENNKIDWFSSENIRIAELSVTGKSRLEIPTRPPKPTCANGLGF